MAPELMGVAGAESGVTLIELLMVIAVVGILLAIGVANYARWRATSAVMQGAQEFTQAVRTTRSGAKRANACWQISLMASSASNTQYQVKEYSGSSCPTGTTPAPTRTRVYDMPAGTQLIRVDGAGALSTTASVINFVPPYATSDSVPDNFQSRWIANTSIKRDIRVTGLFGKVIVR
ncbi:pilus assembly FimT family protein [Deinococcus koreensis]|uniref:Prepilin-type cleavage/methylation domain-containing protein n=1 Tax=Deinococcus koreensis TaxID=2054903 RepID=A0A2K3UUL8_9DEIO|nr:type II secretion system protein [Deinococcus koreensis]PNY80227.1 hypothetical protein CVO96_01610 [Deinococcus koreensis]